MTEARNLRVQSLNLKKSESLGQTPSLITSPQKLLLLLLLLYQYLQYKQHNILNKLLPDPLVLNANMLNSMPNFILLLNLKKNSYCFFCGATALLGPRPPHCLGFEIIHRNTILCRNSLEEVSARHSDGYLTTHNIHNREIPMPPTGFQPWTPASERPQTYFLYSVATRIGMRLHKYVKNTKLLNSQQVQQGSRICLVRQEFLVWSKLPPSQSPPSHTSPTKQKNNDEGATNMR
jgi:hypothetical protein